MRDSERLARRGFLSRVAVGAGALGLAPRASLFALPSSSGVAAADDEYDALVKLANNENNYGPPESVIKAMTHAFKYSMRYGYPNSGVVQAIAERDGVKPENVLLAAGSGEILDVSCSAFLGGLKKIVGSDPSYSILYSHATGLKSETIRIPLLPDYQQDIPAMIRATQQNYRDVGFVYLCNPNNPTGRVVPRDQVRRLLDEIPPDVPVLIDEAYHHFVADPSYASSMSYVNEGRRVIVARTFSKISGLAGMRLGYAVAPRELLAPMRAHMTGSTSAVVQYGGAAALKDTASQAWVRKVTIEEREKTTRELRALGYETIPSDANFFMVHLKRPVQPVITAFREKGVLVGRPFPPMLEHLRVSVGTPEDMKRFIAAFRDVMAKPVQKG